MGLLARGSCKPPSEVEGGLGRASQANFPLGLHEHLTPKTGANRAPAEVPDTHPVFGRSADMDRDAPAPVQLRVQRAQQRTAKL